MLTYLLQSISIPKEFLNELNKIFFEFLWSNKVEKIKRKMLIGPKIDGGLDMIELNIFTKTIRVKWINLLNNETQATWKIIPRFFLNQFGKHLLLFKMNVDSVKSLPKPKTSLPIFYSEIIEIWIYTKSQMISPYIQPNTFYDIRKQVLWGNKYIKRNGKCLIFHNWIESNIIYVNDILSNEGTISEAYILNKLNNKRNWVSEIYSIKQSIPKTWLNILKKEISVKSQVKTTLTEGLLASIKDMSNKEIKIQFIKHNMFIFFGNVTLILKLIGNSYIIF